MSLKSLELKGLAPRFPGLVTDRTRAVYGGLVARLSNRFRNLNPANSNIYKERQQEFLQANGDEGRIAEILWHPVYILPLVGLWKDKESGLQPTPGLLDRIKEICGTHRKGYLGLLQLRELLSLFFSRYDELTYVDALGQALCDHLGRYEDRKLVFGLDKFKKYAKEFLNARGHEQLADLTGQARNSGGNLPDMAEQYGIPTRNSRFYEAALVAYYVTRLKNMKPNQQNEELLYEVQNPEVYDKKVDAESYLGHKVLTILIDKLRDSRQPPSELWLGTLLTIGHDPRIPKTNPHFQKWWGRLGNEYLQCMYAWLSEFDLELFLKIFKQLADNMAVHGKEDMQRMFEHRATFLRGLLKKKLILGTRLFLSKKAEKYFRDNWNADQQPPAYSLISDISNEVFAAFYLNLGDAHMIEGTHNFALSIMDKLPEKSPLQSVFKIIDIEKRSLGMGIMEQYYDEFGDNKRFARIYHYPSGVWRNDAVDHLRLKLGINILESDVTGNGAYHIRKKQ